MPNIVDFGPNIITKEIEVPVVVPADVEIGQCTVNAYFDQLTIPSAADNIIIISRGTPIDQNAITQVNDSFVFGLINNRVLYAVGYYRRGDNYVEIASGQNSRTYFYLSNTNASTTLHANGNYLFRLNYGVIVGIDYYYYAW